MLAKVIQEITHITEDNRINLENYMESISYVENAYKLINKLKMIVPINSTKFDASFKGRMTCEKFNLSGTPCENEMRYFIVKSALFLEDKTKKEQIRIDIGPMCESIEFDGETIKFILK